MGRSRRGSSPATARRFFLVTAVSFGFPAPGTLGPTHATMGTFDGIHRGHLALLKPLIAGAQAGGAASVLVTFEPHPRCVLDPDHCPPNLTTLDEKAWLLEQLGLDHLIVIPFTPQLAALSAPAFMQRLLRGMQLRRLVMLGQMRAAAQLLGRDYFFRSTVEHGAQRGRQLGFPTANLRIAPNKLIPATAVYAARVDLDGETHDGALSVGFRPTFGGNTLTVEVFLLEFDGDLYDKLITVWFVQRLRAEKRFATIPALQQQMGKDVQNARRILGGAQD